MLRFVYTAHGYPFDNQTLSYVFSLFDKVSVWPRRDRVDVVALKQRSSPRQKETRNERRNRIDIEELCH